MRQWTGLTRDEQGDVLKTAASWRDEGKDYETILDLFLQDQGIELSRSGLRGRLSEYRRGEISFDGLATDNDEERLFTYDLTSYVDGNGWVRILPMGDFHWGRQCDKELVKRNLDWASSHNVPIFGMGDLAEFALKDSPGMAIYEEDSPQVIRTELRALLKPYADAGLFKGDFWSNHSGRIHKRVGLNEALNFCEEALGVDFWGFSAFFELKVGEQVYTMWGSHGASGAVTLSSKINTVEKIGTYVDADIYLYGHVHDLFTWSRLKRAVVNGKITELRRTFVLTGAFLKWKGSYAEQKLYAPTKRGSAKIQLSAEKHDVHVSI